MAYYEMLRVGLPIIRFTFIAPKQGVSHLALTVMIVDNGISLGLVSCKGAVHKVYHGVIGRNNALCIVSAYCSALAFYLVVDKEGIDGKQRSVCFAIVNTGKEDCTATWCLIFIILRLGHRAVACEYRADDIKPCVTQIHRAATHAEVVEEAATAYGIAYAVGIKSAATAGLVVLFGIAHVVIRLAVFHGKSVKHYAVFGILIVGEQHVINIACCGGSVDFSRKDCLLFQLPRLVNAVTVEVGIVTVLQQCVYIRFVTYRLVSSFRRD